MPHSISYTASPLGTIKITDDGNAITGVSFTDAEVPAKQAPSRLALSCMAQLKEYFSGERRSFNLPLLAAGTAFQQDAWRALCTISYGSTITYGEQARRIHRPLAARAVGAANGRNPISIIVPCHRVVGVGGAPTGYAGGLWRKEWLLKMERNNEAHNIM